LLSQLASPHVSKVAADEEAQWKKPTSTVGEEARVSAGGMGWWFGQVREREREREREGGD
jgi:hypothetical protein